MVGDLSPSEGSSISGGSKGKAFREVIENQKIKMVQITHDDDSLHKPKTKHDISKFGLNIVAGSSSKIDIINNKGKDSERHYHHDELDHDDDKSTQKTYGCNFCKREFSSSQALGGHQNAHKQERAIAKQRQAGIISDHHLSVLGRHRSSHFPYYSNYPNYYANPLINYGPLSYDRPFGVKLESMVRKPSYKPNSGFKRDHQTLDRLRACSGTSSRVEEIDYISPLTHQCEHISSSPAVSTDTAIGDRRTKFISEKALKEDDANLDSSGLDLSLKL